RVHAVLGDHGSIDVLQDAQALITELSSPRDECIVLDPALITPAIAQTIASSVAAFPRPIVAYSSVTTEALESAVILAQYTAASFVFRGTPNERSALEHALLLTPDSTLGIELLALLQENMAKLPTGLRHRMTTILRNGDGPQSPDALAAASAIARRSLDRSLAEAGFTSARRVIEVVRIMSAFRAITTSRMALTQIATMLGYRSQRALDMKLGQFLDTTGSRLRKQPSSTQESARKLSIQLTSREPVQQKADPLPAAKPKKPGAPGLRLVTDDQNSKHQSRRSASGEG
ncbi:MAG: hypothetical protein ABI311_00965, partial [Gemmatimonadaceae bacterium]